MSARACSRVTRPRSGNEYPERSEMRLAVKLKARSPKSIFAFCDITNDRLFLLVGSLLLASSLRFVAHIQFERVAEHVVFGFSRGISI